ncbi:hypothetical protein MNEG_3510 [Monoraphidium neglectum]|uniref:Major facilitator superfamily (MFS) profile domain-containing protein n=1 Tax=Monoraphidium neglectum TaxID=145388 RepID=A0A0D2NHG9_9CHLO|nr:hypothetical protein MNEG_3510 [Monoraphidium neglectum]KIZ04451.1 hypothetical protein MNEG_3510 [Monoraphidium neglectum]|eukprot:XP_013903470.1 hypothetical protein MNEG_3510 [Monoraphidium neglectum]
MAAMQAAARVRTAFLVNLAMVVESANEQILPAVYLFVGSSLHATPSQLGTLTLCRALVQTLASPLSGILGDRSDRRLVLAAGAFIWGVMTSAIGASHSLHAAMAFAAVNGLGLALLVPCCQSLVADLHPPERRGRAFGLMQLTGAIGGLAGSVFATNMGASAALAAAGWEGWRVAFHIVAAVSILTDPALSPLPQPAPPLPSPPPHLEPSGILPKVEAEALLAAQHAQPQQQHTALAVPSLLGHPHAWEGEEALSTGAAGPHHLAHLHQQQRRDAAAAAGAARGDGNAPTWDGDGGAGGGSGWEDAEGSEDGASKKRRRFRRKGLVADITWVLRIPTFQAIVLQGIVGCFPWQAAVFFTLWLQLQGFKSSTASMITATFGAGVAMGALLGGFIGDRMARRLPDSGRIFTAQFSVASGIPLTWLLLKGIPSQAALATDPRAYSAVLFVLGLTCTWAGAGCNSPIFAEIVPEDMRSLVYAFDRSLESSLAACAAPAVGLLAERVWGFTGAVSQDSMEDGVLRAKNAAALGSSLLACMALPWTACLFFYTVLHFTYVSNIKLQNSGTDCFVALAGVDM